MSSPSTIIQQVRVRLDTKIKGRSHGLKRRVNFFSLSSLVFISLKRSCKFIHPVSDEVSRSYDRDMPPILLYK